MYIYRLHRETWIAKPIGEVFDFFSRAGNLERITPPWMRFRILTRSPISMKAGTTISYKLRVHGISIEWLTVIEKWTPPSEFIDIQKTGPYQFWRHTHRFYERDGGTVATDYVEYALPFGILGRLVNRLQVARDLKSIFDYRSERIQELFSRGA
jgi:ligand-binding SRPBCC domain-containing protein